MILARQEVNDFLSTYALYIVLGFVLILAITVCVILLVNKYNKNKTTKKTKETSIEKFYGFVGGKENIDDIRLVGSRLTLVLKDVNLLNKDEIKTLGVNNIISLKEKVTLVLDETGKTYFKDITL